MNMFYQLLSFFQNIQYVNYFVSLGIWVVDVVFCYFGEHRIFLELRTFSLSLAALFKGLKTYIRKKLTKLH